MKTLRVLMAFIVLTGLGCGGGGGGASPGGGPTGVNVISGVAATGSPMVGTAHLKDSSSPPKELTSPIAPDGSFSFDITGTSAPYLLKATDANGSLYSYSAVQGTTNITPLTHILVSSASAANGQDLVALYANPTAAALQDIGSRLNKSSSDLSEKLKPVLAKYGVEAVNPFSDKFAANHVGMDDLFDDVSMSINSSVVTFTNKGTGIVLYTSPVADLSAGTMTAENVPEPQIPAPLISTDTLPDGTQDQPYSQSVKASGGSGSYSWSILSGALPAGLSLSSSTGLISGTPTSVGPADFTVVATDTQTKAYGTKRLSLLVASKPAALNTFTTNTTWTGGTLPLTVKGTAVLTLTAVSGNQVTYETPAFVTLRNPITLPFPYNGIYEQNPMHFIFGQSPSLNPQFTFMMESAQSWAPTLSMDYGTSSYSQVIKYWDVTLQPGLLTATLAATNPGAIPVVSSFNNYIAIPNHTRLQILPDSKFEIRVANGAATIAATGIVLSIEGFSVVKIPFSITLTFI